MKQKNLFFIKKVNSYREFMPQLDFSFYISQICWLLVSFGLFFCVSKFLLLPELGKLLTRREGVINENLRYAQVLLDDAEKLQKQYNQKILDAKSLNDARIDSEVSNLRTSFNDKINNLKKKILAEDNSYLADVRNSVYTIDKSIFNIIVDIVAATAQNIYGSSIDKRDVEKMIKAKLAVKFNVELV